MLQGRQIARCVADSGPFASGLAVMLFLSGCLTYDQQMRQIRDNCRMGQVDQAADLALKRAETNRNGKDGLIWSLEAGALLRVAGRAEESSRMFAGADNLYESCQQQAKLRVGREGLSLLTNPASLPYSGRYYDGIMISVYQTLGALEQEDVASARVFINRAYTRQQDAVADRAARIEKERSQIESDANVSKTMQDPAFQTAVSGLNKPVEGLAVYADYVNPFAVYLDGIFHWCAGVDDSDLQRARKCFERVSAFAPSNRYVRDDRERMERASAPGEDGFCYIVFEGGMAPRREAVRIDIPIIVTRVSYVGVSFPRLVMDRTPVGRLAVEAGGQRLMTEPVASMDAVIEQDFRDELPSVIAHATASAVAKAVAAYAINSAAAESGRNAQLVSQVLTAGYQLVMNVADTRTWTTLPKEFQICKIPIPDDRKIVLSSADGNWRREETLKDGRVIVLWARALDNAKVITATQLVLKK